MIGLSSYIYCIAMCKLHVHVPAAGEEGGLQAKAEGGASGLERHASLLNEVALAADIL